MATIKDTATRTVAGASTPDGIDFSNCPAKGKDDWCGCEVCIKHWRYVSIPDKDMFDYDHPRVGINQHNYEHGNTYLVPPKVAEEIIDILARRAAQDIRVLQPKKDMKALYDLYKQRGADSVDLTPNNTK